MSAPTTVVGTSLIFMRDTIVRPPHELVLTSGWANVLAADEGELHIMGRVLRVTATLVGVLVIGALAALGAVGLFDLKNPFQEETVDRTQPALLKSVQDLSQYHAAVGNFEVIVDIEKDVDWVPDFVAGERSLFVAAGTVNAYVDFSSLADGDLSLSEDRKTVTIRLPEAELDKPNLDQERTYLFAQERGAFNRIKDAFSSKDQQAVYTLAEGKIAAAAKESELAQRASENTKAMLIGMFNALDMKVAFLEPALRGD